jgi:hypothetical protein
MDSVNLDLRTGQTSSSTAGTTASIPSSTGPNNYARAFAQILNMIPNQTIVCLYY